MRIPDVAEEASIPLLLRLVHERSTTLVVHRDAVTGARVDVRPDPITFTFETSTRKLLRLEGRVPPKLRVGDHWSAFDARVEYDFFAATYR